MQICILYLLLVCGNHWRGGGGLAHLSCVLCRLGSSRGVSWSCRRVVCRDWVGSRIKEWGWQPVLEGAKDGGLELGWK